MKRKVWIITIVITLLLLPITVSARKVETKDIKGIYPIASDADLDFRFRNKTGKTITVDEWIGFKSSKTGKWVSAIRTCNESSDPLLKPVKVAKNYSRCIRFTIPGVKAKEGLYDADRAYMNFKVGNTWYHFVFDFDIGDAGYSVNLHYSDFTPTKVLKGKVSFSPVKFMTASYKQYKMIKMGMTYKQVKKISGFNGKLKSENGDTSVYRWTGDDYGVYVRVTFKNGKVIRKTEKGYSHL